MRRGEEGGQSSKTPHIQGQAEEEPVREPMLWSQRPEERTRRKGTVVAEAWTVGTCGLPGAGAQGVL